MKKRISHLMSTSVFALLSSVSAANAGDIALGEYLSGQCTTCHQISGKTSSIPPIVGWDEEAFISVLMSYKTKERENKVMQNIASSLAKEDIEALATYFASIKPKDQ